MSRPLCYIRPSISLSYIQPSLSACACASGPRPERRSCENQAKQREGGQGGQGSGRAAECAGTCSHLMPERRARRRATHTDSRGKNGTSCLSCGGATSLKTSRMRCCAKHANSSLVCAPSPPSAPPLASFQSLSRIGAMLPAPARAALEGRAEGMGRAVVLARSALIRTMRAPCACSLHVLFCLNQLLCNAVLARACGSAPGCWLLTRWACCAMSLLRLSFRCLCVSAANKGGGLLQNLARGIRG